MLLEVMQYNLQAEFAQRIGELMKEKERLEQQLVQVILYTH